MTSIKEQIAKSLLYYRKKSGLNQKQFAELLKVKNTSVSNWEKGQNSIDIENLYKACQIFGVTLNDMYGENTEAKNQIILSDHEENIIIAYREKKDMQSAVDQLLGIAKQNT